jgi:hypothetical protein
MTRGTDATTAASRTSAPPTSQRRATPGFVDATITPPRTGPAMYCANVALRPSNPLTANRPVSSTIDVASSRRLLDPAIRKVAPSRSPPMRTGSVR